MPVYEYMCPEGHQFEIRCSVSARPESPSCLGPIIDGSGTEEDPWIRAPCENKAKQVFLTPPITWIPGVDHTTVLDYPGSKSLKAGHVHSHGFKYATKVSVGAGGALNPRTSAEMPLASRVIPDYKTSTKRRLRKEGLL